MKLLVRISTLFLLCALCTVAVAETYKIGFVNVDRAVKKSPQYAATSKALEEEFSRRNKELIDQQKQLKKLEDKLALDSAIMSDTEVRHLESDIRSRRRSLNNFREEFREDRNLRNNEELNKLLRKFSEVVIQVGKEESVDLILNQESVIYFNSRIDLTGTVLEKMKSIHKASTK
ncbi:MAG: OmpH family outer membrane protein [Sedimenticola sp.]